MGFLLSSSSWLLKLPIAETKSYIFRCRSRFRRRRVCVSSLNFAAVSKVHDLITCESKVQIVIALGRHEVLFALLGRHGVLTNDT